MKNMLETCTKRSIIRKCRSTNRCLWMAVLVLLAFCSGAHAADKPGASYILGAEDVIEIMVRNHDDLNRVLTIRPDGKITLPRINEIKAAGKTASALAAEIQAQLEKSLNHAEVTVSVKEVHPRRVRVLGAVKTAGTYELKPNWRFMDLVAVAGGLSTKSVRISGRVVRAGKVIPFSVEQAVLKPGSAANVPLQPDDLVILDQQDITKQVHVVGQVKTPGAYDLEEGLNPISLIAETGGATTNAILSKVYVLRGAAQIPMDLQAVLMDGKENTSITQFKFQPGDVLVVPENQARYSIMGQVTKPGYYSLPEKQREATVLKALATAGGQLLDSDLSKAAITRTEDGQSTVVPVNIEAMIKGDVPDNIVLRADDVLYIPQAPDPQVHVIGKVNKPGAYDLKPGLTLMSLFAEAGSAASGASLRKAYVLRDGTQTPINLYAALIGGNPDKTVTDFKLQSGDVLVIPDVSNQVNIIGQVNKPGVFDLDDTLTPASLIGQAGGIIEDKAALSKAFVMRQGTQTPLNLQSVLGDGTPDPTVANFKFQPGDVLVVPESQVRYAVLGQVNKPGYYSYPEKKGEATILNALSEAGGQAADSDLSKAGIVRVVNGQAVSIPVDINRMLKKAGPGSQMELQPGDVLYIPARGAKTSLLPLLGPIAVLLGGL